VDQAKCLVITGKLLNCWNDERMDPSPVPKISAGQYSGIDRKKKVAPAVAKTNF